MNSLEAEKIKNANFARRRITITADRTGALPTRIEVMRAGTWIDSMKGTLIITTGDLQEFKINFDNGLGQAGEGLGLPIDFMHESWGKAAGWIKNVEVEDEVLYATVEWTDAGRNALLSGEFKCFSPTFYPACLGEWQDPEDYTLTARNVLEGGALTNIPFFKDLTPIMASKSDQDGRSKNVIFINASEKKENTMPTLEEVRAKDNDALTDEERTLLTENKAELTAEEQAKFGFEVSETAEQKAEREAAEAKAAEEAEAAASATAQPVAASAVKGNEGNVVMAAAEVKKMNDKIDELSAYQAEQKKKEVRASVETHVARGAIKADQIDKWTNAILASKDNAELLSNLPDNSVMASEQGADAGSNAVSASAEIMSKANKLVEASEGKTSMGDAISKVRKDNPNLAQAADEEAN